MTKALQTGQRPGADRPADRRTARRRDAVSARRWPARTAASTCPSWSRAASASTPPTAPARSATAWARIYDFDPAQDHHRLVEAAARRRDGAGLGVAVSAAADQARGGEVQDQPEAAVRGADQGRSRTCCSTGRRATRPDAPASTASSLPARHPRRDQVRGLSRVHDAVHVRDECPQLPRPPAAAGVARRHHP